MRLIKFELLLSALAATVPISLPAAIVHIGNVTPQVNSWSISTAGYIGKTSAGSVTVDAGSLLASQQVDLGYNSGATGAATVTGAGSTWTNSGGLYVGSSGDGTLDIEAGGQVSTVWGYLGYDSGSTGMATVTGAGSKWTNSTLLDVGRDGIGKLTVADGGEVIAGAIRASLSDLHGDGTITASGAVLDANMLFDAAHGASQTMAFGSGGTFKLTASGGQLGAGYNQLGVGYKQSGSLIVSEGVDVSSSFGALGYHPGSTGTATVTGFGSTWAQTSGFVVGRSGNGALTIDAGGQVSSDRSVLGSTRGSTGAATVSGLDSTWTNTHYLYVGYDGDGTLTIEAGGKVSSANGNLGYYSGATGTASVTGAGSTWTNSGSLYVGGSDYHTEGRGGYGRLTVSDGGEVVATTLFASLSDLHGDGTITASGAVLDADIVFDAALGASQNIAFGSGGMLNLTMAGGDLGAGYTKSGGLTVSEGVNVSSSRGYLGYHTGSTGVAAVTGSGSTWNNSGNLTVGYYGNGTLTIDEGGLVSVGGTLAIGGSPIGGSSDFINMTTGGMLALHGAADDSLSQFLNLVQGNDAIRFWDDSFSGWAPLMAATLGVDYTLEYLAAGDLAGYTLLTVGNFVPEPSTVILLLAGAALVVVRRCRQ